MGMLGSLVAHLAGRHTQEERKGKREDESRDDEHALHETSRDGLLSIFLG